MAYSRRGLRARRSLLRWSLGMAYSRRGLHAWQLLRTYRRCTAALEETGVVAAPDIGVIRRKRRRAVVPRMR